MTLCLPLASHTPAPAGQVEPHLQRGADRVVQGGLGAELYEAHAAQEVSGASRARARACTRLAAASRNFKLMQTRSGEGLEALSLYLRRMFLAVRVCFGIGRTGGVP